MIGMNSSDLLMKHKTALENRTIIINGENMRKERMGNSLERNLNNRILVTGAGGFIGGALCRYFKDKGFVNIGRPIKSWFLAGISVSPECKEHYLGRYR